MVIVTSWKRRFDSARQPDGSALCPLRSRKEGTTPAEIAAALR